MPDGDRRSVVRVFAGVFPEVSQTFVVDHVAELAARGWETTVHALRRGAGSADELAKSAVHIEYAPPIGLSLARRLGTLANIARPHGLTDALWFFVQRARRRPAMLAWHGYQLARSFPRRPVAASILHAHLAPVGAAVAQLKRQGILRGPLVLSVHGFDITHAVHQGIRPYGEVFEQASDVLVTTAFMAERTIAAGCPAHKIRRVPLGVKPARFRFRERRLDPTRVPHILTVARLVEKKGHHVALRAMKRLAVDGLEFRYIIVGDGEQKHALRAQARKLGLEERVDFLGAQSREQILKQYDRADLFLLPAVRAQDGDQEGQGIVLQEAQACGLPVVSSRVGGIPEGVAENHSAVLVEPGDDIELADALHGLIAAAETWPAMGRAGRDYVCRHFDYEDTISKILAIYERHR